VSSAPTSPIFTNQGGWNFPVVQVALTPGVQAFAIDARSRAARVESNRSRLQLNGVTKLDAQQFDLRSARLTLRRLLHEAYAGGELVDDPAGNDFAPVTLSPDAHATAKMATFRTSAAQAPRTTVDVRWKPNKQELSFDIDVNAASIAEPQRCLGVPAITKLHFVLEIEGGGLAAPLTLSQVADWECIFDRDGNVTTLRYFGNPFFGRTLEAMR
jgi:hypothetical protein